MRIFKFFSRMTHDVHSFEWPKVLTHHSCVFRTTHLSFRLQFAAFSRDCQLFGRCFDKYANYFPAECKRYAPSMRAYDYRFEISLLRIEVRVRPRRSPRISFDSNRFSNTLWDSCKYQFAYKWHLITSFAGGGFPHASKVRKMIFSVGIN